MIASFLHACTHQVSRPELETRHLAVDWEAMETQRLDTGDWLVEGVPLTPAQWPLEGSLKSLLELDFIGVIDHFDLSFNSGNLEGDALETLFEEDFVPAYVRVTNTGSAPRTFIPWDLRLMADGGAELYGVPKIELPGRFTEIDWARTGTGLLVAALFVVLIVLSAKEGRGGVHLGGNIGGSSPNSTGADEFVAEPDDVGILDAITLAPGESREGFVFFHLGQTVRDWTTVQLVLP